MTIFDKKTKFIFFYNLQHLFCLKILSVNLPLLETAGQP